MNASTQSEVWCFDPSLGSHPEHDRGISSKEADGEEIRACHRPHASAQRTIWADNDGIERKINRIDRAEEQASGKAFT